MCRVRYGLENKVAVITGAGRGIGKAVALALGRQGVAVVANARTGQAVQKTANEIVDGGGTATFFAGDVGCERQADGLMGHALSLYGTIDILVHCAGVTRDKMLHRMETDSWSQVINTNLNSSFYLTRTAAEHMRPQGYGRIVLVGSPASNGNVGQANYAAAKAGLVGLCKTAAKELGRCGITCNIVEPGFIDTDMTAAIPDDTKAKMLERIPAGRAGKPADIANLVCFLVSGQASYINGAVLPVNGGWVL